MVRIHPPPPSNAKQNSLVYPRGFFVSEIYEQGVGENHRHGSSRSEPANEDNVACFFATARRGIIPPHHHRIKTKTPRSFFAGRFCFNCSSVQCVRATEGGSSRSEPANEDNVACFFATARRGIIHPPPPSNAKQKSLVYPRGFFVSEIYEQGVGENHRRGSSRSEPANGDNVACFFATARRGIIPPTTIEFKTKQPRLTTGLFCV